MIVNELRGFLDDWDANHPMDEAYIALPIRGQNIEVMLAEIRKMGYAAMVRTTAFGNEIVITDKVGHGDS